MLISRTGALPRLAYFLPLLSGLALMPAFPPLEHGYLAWIALIPLLWFCLKASPRQALTGGFIFGFPLHCYLNFYLTGVLFEYLSLPLAVLSAALLVIFISMFNALFALGVCRARRSGRALGLAFVIPTLWLLMEYARGLSFIGYNVGYLGYTQWNYLPVLGTAAVFGYWGLPFMMVAFQSILLLGFTGALRGKDLATAAVILALLFAGGAVLPQAFPVDREEAPLWTALIQGNSAPGEILPRSGESGTSKEIILQRYLALTRRAAAEEPRVELVVWPETVVDLSLRSDHNDLHRAEMRGLARELDISILYGARVRTDEDLFNSIVRLTPGDDELQIYHKRRLVPFVEYFPMEDLLNRLLDLDFLLGRYTAGEDIVVFDIYGRPVSGVVCFESYFGDYTRLFSQRGSGHLFVVTNDAWFGETIGLEQHAQAAAIRAVEMGAGVTQVANSGITISFDYRGRELLRSGKSVQGIYVLPLDLARRQTIYSCAGDYFPAFWALFLLGYICVSRAKKSKNHKRLKTLD